MSALQCDTSTPYNLCGIRTQFNHKVELSACGQRLLLIGQTLGGSAVPEMAVQVRNDEAELFGEGSMLANMVSAARCQNQFNEIWALPIADFGTKGSAEITFSGAGAATKSDLISLIVNGKIYRIAFAVGDTDAMVAAAFALAIDDPSLTVTASGAVLTIETKNGGQEGGFLDIRTQYRNIAGPQELGVAVTVTPGVGVPSLSGPLGMLNGDPHTFIVNPYTDPVSMADMKAHLCNTWKPFLRVRAEAFSIVSGDVASNVAVASINAPQIHLASYKDTLTPRHEVAAAFGAASYSVLNTCNDPLTLSNPLCGEVLDCVMATDVMDRVSVEEADELAGAGVGILQVNAAGNVEIGEFTTTYRTDDSGVADVAFSDGSNVARSRFVAEYIESNINATFRGFSFRGDEYTRRPGQKVTTIGKLKAFIQGMGFELSALNIIEDPEDFAAEVKVSIDENSRCVNISVYPDFVNKLCCINLFINSRL